MTESLDVGIDLGTTNSAVAVLENGAPTIVKANDLTDVTPSVVWMPRAGVIRVGRAARNQLGRDQDNVHAEFKLELGLQGAERRFASAGLSLTPHELSAEVLKSLRGDVQHQYGQLPTRAVITVPAAFKLHQNHATGQAAELAGFSDVALLQEPTAAAFAYGFQHVQGQAYWMVFDLGGGTFDAAVVTTRDGQLQVLDHAGDTNLGGKLIDWGVVDQILAPAVAREFGFTDFRRGNPRWTAVFATLKQAAENAKADLSRATSTFIDTELVLDASRREMFSATLTRDELDRVAEPYYLRAINLCRDSLRQAKLSPDDIDKLVLVGGSTLSPGLRERLADPTVGLGIELDHSQDPSTVVARGAAVFASTLTGAAPVPTGNPDEVTVHWTYPRTTSLPEADIAARLSAPHTTDWSGHRVTVSNLDGRPPFISDQLDVSPDGTFMAEVPLTELTTSHFVLMLTDADGLNREVSPRRISIQHWANEPGAAVLTNGIGLGVYDGTYEQMLPKGTALPARHQRPFRTSHPLTRHSPEPLRIPIVEGEYRRAERNSQVAMIEISGSDLALDLPRGSDVEITFEVDESRRVSVFAYVPLQDAHFHAGVNLTEVRSPDKGELATELQRTQERYEQVRLRTERSGEASAAAGLWRLHDERQLDSARDEVLGSDDPGQAAAAAERMAAVNAALDDIEDELTLPALRTELEELLTELDTRVREVGGPDDQRELETLRALAAEPGLTEARLTELLLRTHTFRNDIDKRDGTLYVRTLRYLCTLVPVMHSPETAKRLLADADRCLEAGDLMGLRQVNTQLIALVPPEYLDRDGDDSGGGGVVPVT